MIAVDVLLEHMTSWLFTLMERWTVPPFHVESGEANGHMRCAASSRIAVIILESALFNPEAQRILLTKNKFVRTGTLQPCATHLLSIYEVLPYRVVLRHTGRSVWFLEAYSSDSKSQFRSFKSSKHLLLGCKITNPRSRLVILCISPSTVITLAVTQYLAKWS